MAPSPLSLFLLRRRSSPFSYPLFFRKPPLFSHVTSQPQSLPFSTASLPLPKELPDSSDPKSNLSARLSFVFDQIDAIDRDRSQKDDALQRIRAWRQTKHATAATAADSTSGEIASSIEEKKEEGGLRDLFLKKDVEVVHPWPEWIELMERLGQQNYFDHRRVDEDKVAENVGIDLSGVKEEVGFDFSRDWTTVRNACMNFGRDRFDILRSLSRKDLQILVGHGCPSMDPKVVFSAKLLRKHVHLDEGDVCSSCSLRNSCGRGYLLTRKEDEARTLDVVRILLTFGFDHVNGSVENKPLMKMKSVKTVVRKLLHEVVKLSAVPIDPNLPPPVIKKPPPKVKQPPPPPKKRVGRDDVEMKKGDWLCPKCDFMNFAKNTVCLQCDAKRPKRQLLPGEWECPQCNFLNYRRNMACFHCDAKRPPDEFMENQLQAKQSGPRMRLERAARMPEVSNAWNFDFDDNESDGADVAAFESADSPKMGEVSSLDDLPHGRIVGGFEDDTRMARTRERGRYLSDYDERKSTVHSDRTGFDDFDDEEDDDVDSYELDGLNNNQAHEVSRKNFSEVDDTSGSEDFDDLDRHTNFNRGAKDYLSGSEDDDLVDHPHWKSSHVADSWKKAERRGGKSLGSDDDIELSSDNDDDVDEGFRSKQRKSRQQSSGRKGITRRGRDSDSDDGNLYSSRNKMRGNKGLSDRRVNNFMEHSESGSARRGEFRSDNRKSNRRNSFGNHSNEFSSRGSRGDGYGERRENDRFQRFDRLDDGDRNRGRANQFSDRSRGSRRDERGSRGDGYGGRRENDRFQRFDRLDDGDRNRGRANQFSDRSRGSRRDERGSRGDGYGASWRRDDGFRRGRSNSFSDQGRSFNDDNDDDRPRRRVIER